jgi:hypothetical protein
MTDFRALCARMADELDHYRQLLMDDRRETHALAAEARAALAQPEPQGPTDEEPTDQEIEEWADAAAEVPLEEMDPEVHGWRRCFKSDEFSETIRAALARWGRPAIEPVPVSERLPEPEDCDAEGQCWLHQPHPVTPETPVWRLMPARCASTIYGTTHWLPHHALPVPALANTINQEN